MEMKTQNKLALVVAYYLSKFDPQSYKELGYEYKSHAHHDIGNLLDVKESTLKNMRDAFDSIHDNSRVGWYQRPLPPSRQRVVKKFEHLTEFDMRHIVLKLLDDFNSSDMQEIGVIEGELSGENEQNDQNHVSSRGITGKSAENFFIEKHKGIFKDFPNLEDTRDFGCGYDFCLSSSDNEKIYVEVKGLSSSVGGISFTGKEWEMAKIYQEQYYLVLVHGIKEEPTEIVFKNPTSMFDAKKRINRVIKIS